MSYLPRVIETLEPPVLIDEWQALPAVWNEVRHSVDRDASPGRFILTGSANVRSARLHSGAGRIVRLRMRPMSFAERQIAPAAVSFMNLASGEADDLGGRTEVDLQTYVREITDSGLPGIRKLPGRRRSTAIKSFVDTVLSHEVPELGAVIRRPESLHAWLRAYAGATSTTATNEALGRAIAEDIRPSRATVIGYRDALTQLWVLDELPAWEPVMSLTKLGRTPKHHLADPALAASLLGLTSEDLLNPNSGNSFVGALFESLCVLSLRVYAEAAGFESAHLRTRGGEHEIDFIAHRADGRVVAVEVKLAQAPNDNEVRHLNWLKKKIGDQLVERMVVTTGSFAYRRSDGVAVIPLALLGP